MGNTFGTDILLQSPNPRGTAAFYVERLGFTITSETPMISLRGPHINLFIMEGPELGPVLEVTVPNVAQARKDLIAAGCVVVRDEPHVPRLYVMDPFGLTYNLTQ